MIREIVKNHPFRFTLALLVLIYASGALLLVRASDSERAGNPSNVQQLPTIDSQVIIEGEGEVETFFVDVAADVGLDFTHSAFRWGFSGDPVAMMGGGLCWIDYDLDGWLDLYVVNSYALAEAGRWQTEAGGLPTGALFKNEEGRFSDVSEESGTALPMRGGGCVAADLNRDSFPDLYITTSRFNILLLNNGDGTFADVSAESAADLYSWQTGVSVGDLNGDRLPDLFIAGYVDINNQIEGSTMGFPNTHYGLPDRILLNQGNNEAGIPQFEEVSAAVGLEPVSDRIEYEYGLGTLLSDVDRDGDLDLFVANDTQPNRLYLNQTFTGPSGEGTEGEVPFQLEEVGPIARVADNNSGMGVASGDFNQDGFLDLFITNLGQQLHSVYQNDGRSGLPAYLEGSDRIGLPEIGVGSTGWGTTWADFDNDSDLDLVIANGHVPLLGPDEAQPLTYYENRTAQGEVGVLRAASNQVGFDLVGNLHGRGGAVADYDNDGDLDWAVTSIGGPLILMENRQTDLNWLILQIEPHEPGTRIELQLEERPSRGPLVQELHIGSSYLASEDPRVHFGMGRSEKAVSLTVIWPDGATARATNIPANSPLIAEKMGNQGMILPQLGGP